MPFYILIKRVVIMNIHQIYSKYSIPPNLKTHMLSTAALAKIIINSWVDAENQVDYERVILSCLLHDMGNIIKFKFQNLDPQSELINELDHWKKVQKEFKEKYGDDEENATFQIVEEISIPNSVVKLLHDKEIYHENDLQKFDNEINICRYVDSVIAPDGIVSLAEKIKYSEIRYGNIPGTRVASDLWPLIVEFLYKIEEIIQKNTIIDITQITQEELTQHFQELLEFEIYG